MQKLDEFLADLYDIAPDAVVTEGPDGDLIIITNLKLSRPSHPACMNELFVHDADLLAS